VFAARRKLAFSFIMDMGGVPGPFIGQIMEIFHKKILLGPSVAPTSMMSMSLGDCSLDLS